jgi:N-acetylglucosamine-6-phosphate deacetylase
MNRQTEHLSGINPVQPSQQVNLVLSEGKFLNGFPEAQYLNALIGPNLKVIPGLVDIHVHGGKGITFGEHPKNLRDELVEYSGWISAKGVTGFLCSIAAPEADQLLELVEAYAKILPLSLPGAACLGLHLEGPFLSEGRRGAFSSNWLRNPTEIEIENLLQAGKGWIRQVTLAPELPGAAAAARQLTAAGVVAAVGHTDADYETISGALAGDFSHVTHTYNAMSVFHHFTPGAAGAVLTSARITAELIADCVHVHPGAMKLLYTCLGPERVVLVTDAMAGAGMPDGTYELIGSPVVVKNGQARRPEDGRLAGSTAVLNHCVANMIDRVNISFAQAIQMASLNPARAMHLDSRLGSFKAGTDANYVVVDAKMNVFQTVVKGKVVFEA